jgi:cysteine desulfurase
MIYLDHNSTTPLAAEAAQAMAPWLGERFGNPASQHTIGRRARQALEQAREGIGRLLGANLSGRTPDRVIFTSGGTEANNLALAGLTGVLEPDTQPGEIAISAIEHPSVLAPAEWLERRGWIVRRLLVTQCGTLDVDAACAAISPATRLVSVMLANNETGAIQPVEAIAEHCRTLNVPLHTDAAQAAGKVPFCFQMLGVSAMTVAAHKFGGPLGIGALIVRHGVELHPLLLGGFQQQGLRAGTESVALAVGMHAALNAWVTEQQERSQRLAELRDRFEAKLTEHFGDQISVLAADAPRLPHTSCIAFHGIDRQALVMALDLAGVAASSGSACASGSSQPSHVIQAMGLGADVLSSAVRFSLGTSTAAADVDAAVACLTRVCDQIRARQTA